MGAGKFGNFNCVLGRRAADDDCQVIRRAGRRAERLHFFKEPGEQRFFVEQRLGFLKQVALVGRAATFGDEQELVFVAIDCGNLYLGRQVGASVDFFVHRQRCQLAVSQVAGEVGVIDASRDGGVIGTTGEYELTFLRFHDGGASVLTHWQHSTGCD